MHRIEIRTEDGTCPAYEFEGGEPALLFFMDGIGIRPAMFEMGERMAAAGYHVLLPDLYYRAGPYAPMDAKTVFSDPVKRDELRSKYFSIATAANLMRDTRAFLDHLGGARVGTTGYCMGGRMSFLSAATYPDRVVASAAYHPAGLVTDAPDSPHLLAPKIKARVYIAQASDDAGFTDEQRDKLDTALANVDHKIEKYPARHGWVPTDTPAHNPAQADRHWQTLLDLLDRSLKSRSGR